MHTLIGIVAWNVTLSRTQGCYLVSHLELHYGLAMHGQGAVVAGMQTWVEKYHSIWALKDVLILDGGRRTFQAKTVARM